MKVYEKQHQSDGNFARTKEKTNERENGNSVVLVVQLVIPDDAEVAIVVEYREWDRNGLGGGDFEIVRFAIWHRPDDALN